MDQKREIFEMTRALERRLLQQRSKKQNQKDPLPSFLVGVHPFQEQSTNRPLNDLAHTESKRYVFLMSKSSLVLLSIFLLVLALVCFLGGFMISKVFKEDVPQTLSGPLATTSTLSKIDVLKDVLDIERTLPPSTATKPPEPLTERRTKPAASPPLIEAPVDDFIPAVAQPVLNERSTDSGSLPNNPLDSRMYDLDFYGRNIDQMRSYVTQERAAWRNEPYQALNSNGAASLKALYTIQLGAFDVEQDARALATIYRQKGYDTFVVPQNTREKGLVHAVQMGGYSTHLEANQQALAFIQKEQRQARVVKGA